MGQGGRRRTQRSSSAHSTLSLREMTVIHYRSFTDLLPECSPTVTPADLCRRYRVGRVNPPAAHSEALLTLSDFQHHGQSLARSTAWPFQHCPLFHYLCLCSGKRVLLLFFTPAHLSACLLAGKILSFNLFFEGSAA